MRMRTLGKRYGAMSVLCMAILIVSSCKADDRRASTLAGQHSELPASSQMSQAGSSIDDSIFRAHIALAKSEGIEKLPIGDRVVAMGKMFLGTPYVAGTLDVDSAHERLILNLRGLDCVTFYENSLAMARVIVEHRNPTLADYEAELASLRYRNGKMEGYASRLHYSIDYFYNNAQKGVFRIVTRDVGGKYVVHDERQINFMTTHRSSYKPLENNDSLYNEIANVEKSIRARNDFYYIPKADVAKVEQNIQSGDILGITTNIAGLDCSHTGIAVRQPDGRIHFMHASSLEHKVIISEKPLADYLTHSSHQTGIIVNRPLENRKS